MTHEFRYSVAELTPYIDWTYFLHAWKVPAESAEAVTLLSEAAQVLQVLGDSQVLNIRGLAGLFAAGSRGDDILITADDGTQVVVPCLRQQHTLPGRPCLCLADFIRPLEHGTAADRIGVFATSANYCPGHDHTADAYGEIMTQTLCDRLAEAAACRLHEVVRKTIWAYAPEENLTIQDLLRERNQGIRPAIGYPSLPDQSINFILSLLIGMDRIGISLTENGAMLPSASVSGLMIAHPEARYFTVGPIDGVQLSDYALRRGLPLQKVKRFLRGDF